MAAILTGWSTLKKLMWYYAIKHIKHLGTREKPEKMKPETPEK